MDIRLTWEQKLVALNVLAKCTLEMRKPGDWWVYQQVEKKVGTVLEAIFGEGIGPEEAVEWHWKQMTQDVKEGEYLVTYGMDREKRKAHKWNGFMWEPVDEKRMQELYGKQNT